jgi:hypothetical protein
MGLGDAGGWLPLPHRKSVSKPLNFKARKHGANTGGVLPVVAAKPPAFRRGGYKATIE